MDWQSFIFGAAACFALILLANIINAKIKR